MNDARNGELVAAHYGPGDLFSVNNATAAHVPGLFRRNERLNLHFATAHGPVALILVGALNVGTINTIWTGDIRPRRHGVAEAFNLNELQSDRQFEKGATLGWFNMGSTVILIAPPGASDNFEAIKAGQTLTMGETIGRFQDGA